jgi:predicted permease
MRRVPLWRRYARFFGADPAADVKDELRFHLEAKAEDLMNQGWPADTALREAERQFGDLHAVQQIGERMGGDMERQRQVRDYWTDCVQDVRHAFRTFARDRGFAVVAILVLALGVGVNVAVFSVVDGLLLRPLPFADSQRLVWFKGGKNLEEKTRAAAGLSGETYTVDAFQEYQRNNQSFEALTSYQTFYGSQAYKLTGAGVPKQVAAVEVADNFFPTLGVDPVLGRNFSREESLKGGRPAALLSYFFWKNQFAGDPAIVGKAITVNGAPVTVVGVLPASFDFRTVFAPGMKVDLFVPAVMDFWRGWGNTLAVVGRLKPGVTVAQAQAEADSLFPHLKSLHQDWYEDYASTLTTLKDHVDGKLRRSLVVLWSAVGIILLIVGVNLSNLQLARAASRAKEFAMRGALGAGRGRIVRQLLTESLVLSLGGAVLGLVFAWGIVFYLAHQQSIVLPLLSTIRVDSAALAWTFLIALVIGLLFGLAPALKISGAHLQSAMKESSGGIASGRSHERFRSALVVSEVALACVLLVGAGLLLRSFLRVLEVDPGFRPDHAAAMTVDLLPAGKPPELAARVTMLHAMIDHVSTVPGIESAGIVDMLPLDRNRSWGLDAVGRSYPKDRNDSVFVYLATPGYIGTMGMRLVAGRDFSWQDTSDTQHVILINEASARREWPGEDAVGKMAYGPEKNPVRVIGVVADVHESSLEETSSPELYVPITQNTDVEGATLVVRTRLDPSAVYLSVLNALHAVDPGQPATEFRPLTSLVDRSVSPRRFFVLLVTIFAGLGALLAALGIYGVISYSVTRQTRDIGVRMALGSTRGRVQRDVLFKTLRLAVTGIVLGTAGSIAAARLIASLLYATSPWDSKTYAAMLLLLIAVALLAGYLPARRASRINPLAALRSQ